jgi:hypothetical protein
MNSKLFSRSRAQRNTQRQPRRLAVEALEDRCLMTGTWTPLTNLLPDPVGASAMMLLSDGTVMIQGGGETFASQNWYKLTPDASGSYINGTFSPRASMGLGRLAFPSNVLPNGKVFVAGGEYSGPSTTQNFTNAAELYDPVADAWTPLPPHPEARFGDDPTVVLPNGKILVGSLLTPNTYLFDPATNTWSFAATKLRGDRSDEETWTLLPDGSVLSYDVFSSANTGISTAQRYIPSTNTWVDAGIVPVRLSSSDVGFELGPALLLPDGRVFQVGADGHTALYNPSTNTWTAGPAIPGAQGADDAPGAMLPNGHVMFAVDTPFFNPPTHIFDFDPVANALTDVTPTGTLGAILAGELSQGELMLALPNGDVLLTTEISGQLWEFTPDGAPNDAWRPTITSVAPNGGGTFTVTGTQLNGISEGASFGDDAEMSTNFPIVQLTNNATGQVFYARTFNWTPGVATGSTPVTAQFTVPANLPQAIYSLRVVASGIASAPVTFDTIQALHVVSTNPVDGGMVSTQPTSFAVTFNEPIVPATLQASDLTVNGRAADAVTLDATNKIATFTYITSPVTVQGSQSMAIAANAVTGSDGSSILPFAASFRYDAVTLAVASTTPNIGGVFTIPATTFTYDVTFNEAIDPATVGVGNLTINQGTVTSAVVLPGNTRVRYTISGLTTEGTLTISIPAGLVKDQFDNPGFTPFSASYQIDVGTAPVPTPLTSEAPRGSLIYDTGLTGLINFVNDKDTFTVNLDAGQTVTLLATPTSAGLKPTIQLIDPNNRVLATTTAASAGQAALLQTVATTSAGTYQIVIGGANSTVGNYSVELTLNAAIETEGVTTGSNATPATSQDINGSFLTLNTPLTRAQRGAVLGTTENSFNYVASSVAQSFIDISTTGNRSANAVGNDGTDTLDATQLGGFTFNFFGTTYDSLSFSTNGLISFGVADSDEANTDLSTSPLEPVVAPFWNFMENLNIGVGLTSRAIYWQTVGSGANQQLIIQWNNMNQLGVDPAVTFEAILSTDGTIQFNYGSSFEPIAADFATVGVKAGGTADPQRVLLDFNGVQSPGNLVGPGQSVRLTPPSPTFDFYSFTVGAGQTSTLALTELTAGNVHLDLLGPDGTVLASGVSGGVNQPVAIRNFTFSTAGTYYARVSGDVVTQYSLVVTRDAVFGAGTHLSFATAEDIGGAHSVLGGFASSAGAGTVTLNALDAGSWDSFGDHFAGLENYTVGQVGPGDVLKDYFVFDLSGINQEITSAQLTLSNPFSSYVSPDPSETINFSDVSTSINQLEATGFDQVGIFNDLGSGTSLGTQTVTPGTDVVTTTLNANGLNALTAGLGAQFAIGGSLSSISGTDPQFIFGATGDPTDQRQLTLTLAQTADWYKFTLPGDRSAVQIDTSTFADGPGEPVNTLDPHIELYDASDHLIATGSVLADGRNETIRATGLVPGATYYIRVTTQNNTTGEYVLGVTPLRTPTVTSTVDDAPKGAEDQPDGEFHVPTTASKGWTHIVSSLGFQGDYTIHAQNASPQKSNFAEWDIRATSAHPELFATWVPLPGNATNATYQVFADSSDGGNDDVPLLTVVVDQTRGPNDALLFGTTLAQSLGSVNLPNWEPGTMLTVRLLTLGANGNVVADGVFDPPVGTAALDGARPQFLPVAGSLTGSLSGAPNGIAVPAAAVSHFASGRTNVPQGAGFKITVSAVDDFGNVNAGYSGAVHLNTPDATGGTQDFTFSNNDNGVHVFSSTFNALGFQTLTVVDTTNGAILGGVIVDGLPKS